MAKKKLFGGKETYKEELAEAKAIKSGKITPEQYAKGEKSEGVHGMKCGGKVKKMAMGGMPQRDLGYGSGPRTNMPAINATRPIATRPVSTAPMPALSGIRKAKGGGVEAKGKTKGTTVKMAKGGGVETKGKTRGKIC